MVPATIEVKDVSCRGLTLPLALFGKLPIYAVVSVGDGSGRHGRQQSQSTPFDRTGGRNPEWDNVATMCFDLAAEGSSHRGVPHFLEFEFKVRSGTGGILGDRVVGETQVPVTDLAAEYPEDSGSGGRRFRSVKYQVLSPDGKSSGVLTFFYRLTKRQQPGCGGSPGVTKPSSYPVGRVFDAPPLPQARPVMSSTSGDPPPSPPPPAKVGYFPFPPSPVTTHGAHVMQQPPGSIYYYCCPPIPPPLPPTDPYGYPTIGYQGESWAPPCLPPLPPTATQPYAFPWRGYDLIGGGPRDPWSAGSGSRAPVYGPVGRFYPAGGLTPGDVEIILEDVR